MSTIQRGAAALLFAFALLAASAPAEAFVTYASSNGASLKWGTSPVTWRLSSAGSDDLVDSALESAIQSAFSTWASVSCSTISFSYGGKAASGRDGEIFVRFEESNFDPTVGDALAYALNSSTYSGAIARTDIVYNGAEYVWTTADTNDLEKKDVWAVAVHELGHGIGLTHSRVRTATMFFTYSGVEGRNLDPDDKNGACFLYPAVPFTSGAACDSCQNNNECSGGYCVNHSWESNAAFCGKDCTYSSDCSDGFKCSSVQGDIKQCMPEHDYCGPNGSNIPAGDYCWEGDMCADAMCMPLEDDAYCSQGCNPGTLGNCPTGMKCIDLQDGTGVCARQGDKALGETCESNLDCRSLSCVPVGDETYCSQECTPGGAGCPTGFSCLDVGDGQGLCLKSAARPFGADCVSNLDCASLACYVNYCTQACGEGQACPGDAVCTNGFCAPRGSLPLGATCESHRDCDSGFCTGLPSYVCSKVCATDSECPEGSTCIGNKYCSAITLSREGGPCVTTAGCEAGLTCVYPTPGGQGVCKEGCDALTDQGCAAGKVCLWVYEPDSGAISGTCVTDNGGAGPGQDCNTAVACQPHLVCIPTGDGSICLPDCRTDTGASCGATETCTSFGMQDDPLHGFCMPGGGPVTPDTGPVGTDTGSHPAPDPGIPPVQTDPGVPASPDPGSPPITQPDPGVVAPGVDAAGRPSFDTGPTYQPYPGGGGGGGGGCAGIPTPRSASWPLLLLTGLTAWIVGRSRRGLQRKV
jgi:hypothetical protein